MTEKTFSIPLVSWHALFLQPLPPKGRRLTRCTSQNDFFVRMEFGQERDRNVLYCVWCKHGKPLVFHFVWQPMTGGNEWHHVQWTLVCCWCESDVFVVFAQARNRTKERLDRRNSLRASIRSSKASVLANSRANLTTPTPSGQISLQRNPCLDPKADW